MKGIYTYIYITLYASIFSFYLAVSLIVTNDYSYVILAMPYAFNTFSRIFITYVE